MLLVTCPKSVSSAISGVRSPLVIDTPLPCTSIIPLLAGIPSPVKFIKNGFSHTILKRTKKKAILLRESTWQAQKPKHYEVIKIRREKLRDSFIGNKRIIELGFTHREVYPTSKEWGDYGWSYQIKNVNEAYAKYDSI